MDSPTAPSLGDKTKKRNPSSEADDHGVLAKLPNCSLCSCTTVPTVTESWEDVTEHAQ